MEDDKTLEFYIIRGRTGHPPTINLVLRLRGGEEWIYYFSPKFSILLHCFLFLH